MHDAGIRFLNLYKILCRQHVRTVVWNFDLDHRFQLVHGELTSFKMPQSSIVIKGIFFNEMIIDSRMGKNRWQLTPKYHEPWQHLPTEKQKKASS